MMARHFFSVDLGATSGRTILGTFSDEKIRMEVINRFPNHLIHCNGHYYWDIYELYRNIVEGLKIVGQRKDIQLTSIGIDTWGCDFTLVGKDGGFLRLPYAYRDTHIAGAAEKYFRHFDRDKCYEKTGIQVMDFNSLFQLYILRQNNDSALAAADKILFTPNAISYLLTGNMTTEYTVATTGQIVNARTKRFDAEILQSVGLTEDNFGKFVYPGETIGYLTPEVQQQTGLGKIPVIAVGTHDTASAVAAVPAVEPDFAYLSSGTWSLMGIETKEPVINKRACELNFTNEGGVEGTIRVLKNICGMWLLERCRENWQKYDYDELISQAQSAEPFRSFINPDDPMFANPQNMEIAIRQYCHQTSQPEPCTVGTVVRCIFESLALRYRQVMEALDELSGRRSTVLHIIGGGSCNNLLNQWTADSIGRTVIAGPSEATTLGNIMMQIRAAEPDTNIYQLRSMMTKGLTLSTFVPNQTPAWNQAYKKFIQITTI